MKQKLSFLILLLATPLIYAQGVLIDQMSTNLVEGGAFIQAGQPMGQSFTPSLGAINFAQFMLFDPNFFETSGSTVFVNLRSNSIAGPILSSTAPIYFPDGFLGTTNFLFPTSISLVSGTIYYLQLVVLSGDEMASFITDGSYTGGSEIFQGSPVLNQNLWFQEGIVIVPEPSTVALVLMGTGLIFWRRQKNR